MTKQKAKEAKIRYTLRVPQKLKTLLESEAKDRGLTLNSLIITKLEANKKEDE